MLALASNTEVECFLYYGPLFELYDLATSHCWGLARETVFLLQLSMYAQLNFPNYYAECFINTINFLGKWPLPFRRIVGQNCRINITGKKGCGIELDALSYRKRWRSYQKIPQSVLSVVQNHLVCLTKFDPFDRCSKWWLCMNLMLLKQRLSSL